MVTPVVRCIPFATVVGSPALIAAAANSLCVIAVAEFAIWEIAMRGPRTTIFVSNKPGDGGTSRRSPRRRPSPLNVGAVNGGGGEGGGDSIFPGGKGGGGCGGGGGGVGGGGEGGGGLGGGEGAYQFNGCTKTLSCS